MELRDTLPASEAPEAIRQRVQRRAAVRMTWLALRATGRTQQEARDTMISAGVPEQHLRDAGCVVYVQHVGDVR